MAIFKCKMCGGDLEIAAGESVAECQYCGSKQTLPRFDSERKANLYDRANHFRRNNEFDKAEGIYEQILNEDLTDAEAYWSLVLCRYGIEYVEDPATHRRVPTVNRAQYTSVFADENYKKAIKNAADTLQRELYEAEAKAIDEIQRGILEISEKEDPFDVFICYKETDAQGRRTPDSVLANELYHELTNEGFKVFFSRITLEDKLGTAYEPYIFAALHSAKVMVVLGTKPEYFNAVWVKNEWSRYLALIRAGEKKTLIPAYRDMDPYDLPEEFSHLQAQDMSKLGFMPDLVRGIRKIVDTDKQKETVKETVVQQVVQQSAGGTNLTAQLKRGMIALEDGDWTAADGFFDKALDMDAECAEAYYGKALAAAQCANGDALVQKRIADVPRQGEVLIACERDNAQIDRIVADYMVPGYLTERELRDCFTYDARTYQSLTKAWKKRIESEKEYWERNRQMSRAVRYAKGDFSTMLQSLRSQVETQLNKELSDSIAADENAKTEITQRFRKEMESAEETAESKYHNASTERENEYEALCKMQEEAKTDEDYDYIAHRIRTCGIASYKDCAERANKCNEEARRIREDNRKRAAKRKRTIIATAIVAVVIIVAGILTTIKVIIPSHQYKQAESFLSSGDFDSAIAVFEALGDYKDSAERVLSSKYSKAEYLLVSKDYDSAIAVFEALGDYKDSADRALGTRYDKAEALLVTGDYDGAIQVYDELIEYLGVNNDSADLILKTKYAEAEVMLASGDYRGAAVAFGTLGTFLDSKDRTAALWNEIAVRETVSAGDRHTVGLREDGTVVAVGSNRNHQCDISDWTDIIAVSAGASHTVGLRTDGTVVAVGENSDGRCNVSGWTDIVAISAGDRHTVGLRADGTVVSVGYNGTQQCEVFDWTGIVAISAGAYHTVGLRVDGTVIAVGYNGSHQCEVSQWTDIVAISAGSTHTVGLHADGNVVAVINGTRQCEVSNWTDITAISAGVASTVGLRSDGTVVATGYNDNGQCDVSDWPDVVAISTGTRHTVGIFADGTVVAVGYNDDGRCDVSKWTDIKLPNMEDY